MITINGKSKSTTNRLFWGLVLIGAAVLLILNGIGVDLGYGVNVWRILGGVLCLACIVDRIVEKRFTDLVIPLAFLFLIFEPTIAHAIGRSDDDLTLIPTWTVIFAAVLLTFGLKTIFRGSDGKKHSRFGSSTIYLDGADLSGATITDNMGKVEAYITNKEAYSGEGTITICDNLGSVRLHIPANWNVVANCSDNMGRVSIPEQDDGVFDKTVTIDIRDNLGSIEVIFE